MSDLLVFTTCLLPLTFNLSLFLLLVVTLLDTVLQFTIHN